jgi:hypothetical protein
MPRNKSKRVQNTNRKAKEPYAFNKEQMMKQFTVASATYTPDTANAVYQALNQITTGNTDNTRLSDKVICNSIELLGTLRQYSSLTASAPRPNICSRMLICASTDATNTSPLVTPTDPRSPLDNTVVPDRVEVFYDSGPLMTTPNTQLAVGGTTVQIQNKTYNFKQVVNLSRPVHIRRMRAAYNGVETTFTSGSVFPQNGNIYAVFISDDLVAGTDVAEFRVAFQISFRDFIRGFSAGVNARLDQIEKRLLADKSSNENAGSPSQ